MCAPRLNRKPAISHGAARAGRGGRGMLAIRRIRGALALDRVWRRARVMSPEPRESAALKPVAAPLVAPVREVGRCGGPPRGPRAPWGPRGGGAGLAERGRALALEPHPARRPPPRVRPLPRRPSRCPLRPARLRERRALVRGSEAWETARSAPRRPRPGQLQPQPQRRSRTARGRARRTARRGRRGADPPGGTSTR